MSFDSPFESPFSLVVAVVAVSGFGKGWIPKNFAKGESLKSVCRTHPVVAVGNASVKGSASSAKPNTEITVPPNKVRSAKASNGAKATSPTSPRPGNRNVASPAVACCMHAAGLLRVCMLHGCDMLYHAVYGWDILGLFGVFQVLYLENNWRTPTTKQKVFITNHLISSMMLNIFQYALMIYSLKHSETHTHWDSESVNRWSETARENYRTCRAALSAFEADLLVWGPSP